MVKNNRVCFTDEMLNELDNEIADILSKTEYKYQITSNIEEENAIIKIRDERLKNPDLVISLKSENTNQEKTNKILANIIGPNGYNSIKIETILIDYTDGNYIIVLSILKIISSYLFT